MLRMVIGGLAGLALMALAWPANATLIGDTITYKRFGGRGIQCGPFTPLSFVHTSIVGDGPECVDDEFGKLFKIDFSDFAITLRNDTGPNGLEWSFGSIDWRFREIDLVIVGVTVDPAKLINVSNPDFWNVEVIDSGHGVRLFSQGGPVVIFPNGGEYVIDLVFESVTVPEPSTLTLFGLGLAGLGFFMTRRRRVV